MVEMVETAAILSRAGGALVILDDRTRYRDIDSFIAWAAIERYTRPTAARFSPRISMTNRALGGLARLHNTTVGKGVAIVPARGGGGRGHRSWHQVAKLAGFHPQSSAPS